MESHGEKSSKAAAGAILTFLQQDPFKQGVLVAKHETLVRGTAVTLLQRLKRLLVVFDGVLQLLYIFRPPFPESRLSLPISLLALFRSGIYLQ